MQFVGTCGSAGSDASAIVAAHLLLGLLVRGALPLVAGVAHALLAALWPHNPALPQLALNGTHVKGPIILLLSLISLIPLLTWRNVTGSFGSRKILSTSFAASSEHRLKARHKAQSSQRIYSSMHGEVISSDWVGLL